MAELWDLYDGNKKKIGKTAERGVYEFQDGEYHLVVQAIILNTKNEILISKRAPFKKFGGIWECNGGSVLKGETSLEGILREVKEELGINFSENEATFLKEVKRENKPANFKDLWLFKRDIKDDEITFPDGEATDFKWVGIDEFIEMFNNEEIVPTVDFGRKEYDLALKIKQK